jgi:predicted dehydrogenase
MAGERIGIGFIGAGGIAKQRHLPGLQKVPGVEFVAVANRRRESGEQVAKEWGFKSVKDDWRQVLDDPAVDAVFIATPPYLHKEATLAALKAGKHVFCQARMAMNYADAKEMYDASTQTKLRTMLCPPPHAMAADNVMKRLVKEGFLGRPLEVHVYGINNSFADGAAPLHWRGDADVNGINVYLLGMFVEVIHRWLGFNKRVQAITKVHYPLRPKAGTSESVAVKLPESAVVAAEMENGALASYHLSGVSHHPQPHRAEIHGSEGTLIVDMAANAGNILGARKGEELKEIPIPAGERREWLAEAEFVQAIREGGAVTPDFFEGLKYMEFTQAVIDSSAQGRAVELPLDRVAVGAR